MCFDLSDSWHSSFFLVKLPTAMCFLVSRAAIFTTNFRQKAIWGWKTVYANKNWWGTLCISTGKAEQCREGLRTNALPYSTGSVVGSRHCYFLQQNPPTWINGAILEIMTISKRQSVVSAGSHEHKIDLSCRGRRSDMNFLCLNRLGLVDPIYNVVKVAWRPRSIFRRCQKDRER